MSAEGFALYWAQDAEEQRWATIKGAHVPLDKEGEPTGKVGEKIKRDEARKKHEPRPLETTAPDMARFRELLREHGGTAMKAARSYFREYLQDTHMEARTNKGPVQVHFTGASWRELKRDMNRDALKAELVPYIADIIANGSYRKNELYKGRGDDAACFHEYRKTVQTSAGPKEVIVDVMERKSQNPRHMVYGLTREGSRNYEDRQKKTPAMDSGSFPRMSGVSPAMDSGSFPRMSGVPGSIAAVDANISPQFEVVNLRIEDVTVDEDTIVANVTREFREWLRAERQAQLARDAAPEGCGRVRPGCFTGPFAGLNRISVDGEGRPWA